MGGSRLRRVSINAVPTLMTDESRTRNAGSSLRLRTGVSGAREVHEAVPFARRTSRPSRTAESGAPTGRHPNVKAMPKRRRFVDLIRCSRRNEKLQQQILVDISARLFEFEVVRFLMNRRMHRCGLVHGSASCAHLAHAQKYPTRPIRRFCVRPRGSRRRHGAVGAGKTKLAKGLGQRLIHRETAGGRRFYHRAARVLSSHGRIHMAL